MSLINTRIKCPFPGHWLDVLESTSKVKFSFLFWAHESSGHLSWVLFVVNLISKSRVLRGLRFLPCFGIKMCSKFARFLRVLKMFQWVFSQMRKLQIVSNMLRSKSVLSTFLICRASWLEKSTFFLRMSLADLPGDPKVWRARECYQSSLHCLLQHSFSRRLNLPKSPGSSLKNVLRQQT